MVWRYVIALFFSLKISFGDDLIISIRANTTQNFNSESWNINMQQCLHQNVESCQILIQEGLKTEEQCHAKKECSLIGEIYWNANYFTQALSFFKKSCDGKNMQEVSQLLDEAINSIIDVKEESDIDSLFTTGGTSALLSTINGIDDFELICFLVIK